ncbi:MAG: VPLPA-CTERM sorting domain-containing protein [Candidatus Competibacterales bacterium]
MNRFVKLALGLVAGAATSAHASSITLDFGAVNFPNFGEDASNLEMRFDSVATGINASLTADAIFDGADQFHGSVAGDLRVHTTPGDVNLTLSLFNAAIGDGYTSLFDNGGSAFSWDLMFYDIDANFNVNNGNRWDAVTLITPGTYTVTDTTALLVTQNADGSVAFSGEDAGNRSGQDGLNTFNQAQADAAVLYTVSDTSVINFIYGVDIDGTATAGRNLLVDGGQLSFDGFGTVTGNVGAPVSVPVPAPLSLIAAGIAGFGAIARRRRAHS